MIDLFAYYSDYELDSAIDRHCLRCLGETSPRSKWTHDYEAPLRAPRKRLTKIENFSLCHSWLTRSREEAEEEE